MPQRWTSSVFVPCASESIDELDAGGRRRAGVDVVQVTAARVRVDLEHRAGSRGRVDHRVHIEAYGARALDQAAGRMAERVDERVLERRARSALVISSLFMPNDVWTDATTQSSSAEQIVVVVQ